MPDIPRFRDLPLDPSHPPHSAWFVWGKDDQLGCLNHLTPERTVEAAKLIKTGVSIGLNWELHQMKVPPFYRTGLKHEIFRIGDFCNVRVGDEYLQEMADGKRRMTKSKSIRRRAHNGIHSVTGRFRMEDSIMPSHKMSCFLSNLQEMV